MRTRLEVFLISFFGGVGVGEYCLCECAVHIECFPLSVAISTEEYWLSYYGRGWGCLVTFYLFLLFDPSTQVMELIEFKAEDDDDCYELHNLLSDPHVMVSLCYKTDIFYIDSPTRLSRVSFYFARPA